MCNEAFAPELLIIKLALLFLFFSGVMLSSFSCFCFLSFFLRTIPFSSLLTFFQFSLFFSDLPFLSFLAHNYLPPAASVCHLSSEDFMCCRKKPLFYILSKRLLLEKKKGALILTQYQWNYFWCTLRYIKGGIHKDAITRQYLIFLVFVTPCFLTITKLCFQPTLYRCTHICSYQKNA